MSKAQNPLNARPESLKAGVLLVGGLSSTTEDYLKVIFAMAEPLDGQEGPDGVVGLGPIARRLGVTPGTVTSMMNQLQVRGYLEYLPRRGVRLTESGRQEAVGVVRRHRIIEKFLVEVMGLDWASVHEEAEVLEHAVSGRLLARMDEMLGHPTRDPHGDPIPQADGLVADVQLIPLDRCKPGNYELTRVLVEETATLDWLDARGFRPGAQLQLTRVEPFAATVSVRIGKTSHTLSMQAAAKLLMEEIS